MFTVDENVTYQKIKEKDLVKAFFSMNNHQVATPEMMLEEARSYILFSREAGGKLSAYIGLHLLLTGRKLFYSHSSNPFSDDERNSIEEEALIFVEGLGALLDEINFSNLTSAEQNQWKEKQDLFIEKIEPENSAEEKPAEEIQPEPASVQQEPAAVPPAPEQPVPPVQYAPRTSVQQELAAAPPALEQPVPPVQYAPQAPPTPYAPPAPQQQQPSYPPQPEHEYQPPRRMLNQGNAQKASLPEVEEMPEKTVGRVAGAVSRGPLLRNKQEIIQKAIKAGVVKGPKLSGKRDAQAVPGVVSRDREALARLLTSF
jgi:hypothetical protein